MKKFVNISNTSGRKGKYQKVIQEISESGICPFCPQELTNHHKKPIILNKKYWLLTENMYPYKGAKYHFILIHKYHIESIQEITNDAWIELKEIVEWICSDRKIPGGTLILRFGETDCTGASVSHLHAQLVSSGPENIQNRQPVLARVG